MKTDAQVAALKRMLKHRYNLTIEEYNLIYEKQNQCCAICGLEKILGGYNGLYIDHCHRTNIIRGLLCPNCNTGIGKFFNSPVLLEKAVLYLAA